MISKATNTIAIHSQAAIEQYIELLERHGTWSDDDKRAVGKLLKALNRTEADVSNDAKVVDILSQLAPNFLHQEILRSRRIEAEELAKAFLRNLRAGE
jgi:hypothetical protein